MLFTVEQAFVGREEIRAPLKTPAWEAMVLLEIRKSQDLAKDFGGTASKAEKKICKSKKL